ncbi:MAG: hypothetical protein JWL71_4140 [Acidobacteria bacterium]|nr:hypothetical protein [Acidobacteriota bacterium]
MTQSSEGSPNPFDVTRPAEADARREPVRGRRLSLPLRMDDGSVKEFELPAALDHPSQFSTTEFERLTRAYAEALGLLAPKQP